MSNTMYLLRSHPNRDINGSVFSGQSPRRLMAGFMLTTMFLSMWISNTASTAMMVPIVDAILVELYSVSLSSFVQRGDKRIGNLVDGDTQRDAVLGDADEELIGKERTR